jgi:hypothetical protein
MFQLSQVNNFYRVPPVLIAFGINKSIHAAS